MACQSMIAVCLLDLKSFVMMVKWCGGTFEGVPCVVFFAHLFSETYPDFPSIKRYKFLVFRYIKT